MTISAATTALSRLPKGFSPVQAGFLGRLPGEPAPLDSPDALLLGRLRHTRMRIKCGASLYRAGDPFSALYAIRSGFFKIRTGVEDGREQVTGFHMAGEVLGMDGMGTGSHCADAVALEDSEVFIIPYGEINNIASQRRLNKVMSRELARDRAMLTLLGTMTAEERVASFLVGLSHRFVARGLSPVEFHLRMTRGEIGNHLGLSLEAVSRSFSRFAELGLITVDKKHICIRDMAGLRKLSPADRE